MGNWNTHTHASCALHPSEDPVTCSVQAQRKKARNPKHSAEGAEPWVDLQPIKTLSSFPDDPLETVGCYNLFLTLASEHQRKTKETDALLWRTDSANVRLKPSLHERDANLWPYIFSISLRSKTNKTSLSHYVWPDRKSDVIWIFVEMTPLICVWLICGVFMQWCFSTLERKRFSRCCLLLWWN